jgi:predicted acyl esterase
VTLTEVRPDGTEVLVQSGWLRASHRALDETASTALHPVQTHLEADAAPLPAGESVPVRVDIYPFAHPFRVGSQLRVTIDAPGGNRQIWHWDTISNGETVTIAHDTEHPSRIVLPTLTGIDIPDAYPPCGSLRGQPCRPFSQLS